VVADLFPNARAGGPQARGLANNFKANLRNPALTHIVAWQPKVNECNGDLSPTDWQPNRFALT
jgi:hypothetical protein